MQSVLMGCVPVTITGEPLAGWRAGGLPGSHAWAHGWMHDGLSGVCELGRGASRVRGSRGGSLKACVAACWFADGVHQPFEPELPWHEFSVPVAEADIPELHTRLEAIAPQQLAHMQVGGWAGRRGQGMLHRPSRHRRAGPCHVCLGPTRTCARHLYVAAQARLRCAAQHLFYSSSLGAIIGEDGRYGEPRRRSGAAASASRPLQALPQTFPDSHPAFSRRKQTRSKPSWRSCACGGTTRTLTPLLTCALTSALRASRDAS